MKRIQLTLPPDITPWLQDLARYNGTKLPDAVYTALRAAMGALGQPLIWSTDLPNIKLLRAQAPARLVELFARVDIKGIADGSIAQMEFADDRLNIAEQLSAARPLVTNDAIDLMQRALVAKAALLTILAIEDPTTDLDRLQRNHSNLLASINEVARVVGPPPPNTIRAYHCLKCGAQLEVVCPSPATVHEDRERAMAAAGWKVLDGVGNYLCPACQDG